MFNWNIFRPLTDREQEVLHFLAEGRGNRYIAEKLNLTVRTVKFHTGNIYAKLGVTTRSQAIAWIWKNGETRSLPEDQRKKLYLGTGKNAV